MSSVDYDRLRKYTDIPSVAEALLTKNEREFRLSLTLKFGTEQVLCADCFLVYHCTVRGPAKGGIRFSPGVTLEETCDLAERMTWKTALAGIPFGGGKSGIQMDPKSLSRFEKTAVLKEYVHMLSLEIKNGFYIPAPDMGTGPSDMAIIFGETHIPESVTGKPPRVGGLPGRSEATGRGVQHIVLHAFHDILHKDPRGGVVAVQGFGNVGSHAARFLHDAGVNVVAVSDVSGAIHDPDGLDIPRLMGYVQEHGTLDGAPGHSISNEELLALDVDVLCPCAMENQITADNARDVKASAIVEGANGPTTFEADGILDSRKIPVVPDILANAGGVIASYVEWRQGKSGSITDTKETFDTVEERISLAFEKALALSEEHGIPLRVASQTLAGSELVQSMRDRDWI